MCLILLAWQVHDDFPLVVAANRDEYFDRPTAAARFWQAQNHPDLLAGQDLQAGGTWLGITRSGRFAALTNYREPENRQTASPNPSRGRLVADFLCSDLSAEAYLDGLQSNAADYRAFNLLCGTLHDGLWHFANRGEAATRQQQRLAPGIYGLSNNLLDVPWPKVAQGKSDLAQALKALPDERPLFDLLRDDRLHEDERLPRTGVSLEWERTLSAAFVRAPHYGTRSSTVLKLNRQGFISFDEQTWLTGAQPGNRQRFRFRLSESGYGAS